MDWRIILIFIFLVIAVIGWIFAVIGFISAGTYAARTVDFENTIGRLSAINQQLKYNYSGLEENYSRLQNANQRLENAVGQLESGIADAARFIRDAIKTSGRLEKIATEIGN